MISILLSADNLMSEKYIINALLCTHSLDTCSLLVTIAKLIFFNTKVRVWVQLRPWPIILQLKEQGCLWLHWNENIHSVLTHTTETPVNTGTFFNFAIMLIPYKDCLHCGIWTLSTRFTLGFSLLLTSSHLGHQDYQLLPPQPDVSLKRNEEIYKYSISHTIIPTITNELVIITLSFQLED